MKFLKERGVYLIAILFIIWIIISSLWYVCGVKGFCKEENQNKTNRIVLEEDFNYQNDDYFNRNSEIAKLNNKQRTIKKVIECDTYLKTELKEDDFKDKEEIEKLQIFLNDFNQEELIVDGVYGIGTREAVRRFQEEHTDRVKENNGYVGKETRNEINADYCVAAFNKINNSKIKE